jgi:hypothetical protein
MSSQATKANEIKYSHNIQCEPPEVVVSIALPFIEIIVLLEVVKSFHRQQKRVRLNICITSSVNRPRLSFQDSFEY